jgi:spore maturation protein CgeB
MGGGVGMKAIFFYHAFISCWNNGNAHFLRGVTRELARLGHEIIVCEPSEGWSRTNALRDGGEGILAEISSLVPGVTVRTYGAPLDLDQQLDGADLVIVHEWNTPSLISAIGQRRAGGARFKLLFHDTHHRAITAPQEVSQFDLDGYDGVLAFGEVLREIYVNRGWARRAFTWHEAADTELYKPMPEVEKECDVVWIGNWGDGERSAELSEFLIRPVCELKLSGRMYGVRYPKAALEAIKASKIAYRGWLPNHRAPVAFAQARATLHVPRGPYARQLPGIPTIRIFEALACGVPLISAPWSDDERLFPSGCYLRVGSCATMKLALWALMNDLEMVRCLSRAGLRSIRAQHTCRHRVQELLAIIDSIDTCGHASSFAPQQQRIAS